MGKWHLDHKGALDSLALVVTERAAEYRCGLEVQTAGKDVWVGHALASHSVVHADEFHT